MNYAKIIGLGLLLVVILFSSACAPVHNVDTTKLNNIKNRTFKIGTIKVPCDLQCLPTLYYGQKQKITMLENIQPYEIMKVLQDEYGINYTEENNLVTKSSITNLIALVSDTAGRCYYKENESVGPRDDTVDITFSIFASCGFFSGLNVDLNYEVVIKSEGNTLIKHKDTVKSLEFNNWLGEDDINNIITNAKNIPSALKRDIQKAQP